MFLLLFVLSIFGQWLTGFNEYNKERQKDGSPTLTLAEYSHSGHFIQTTFENWESEFLQMALFVILTISCVKKVHPNQKKCDGREEVDREPNPKKKGAPWAVRQGGWILSVYKHSLSIVLLLLFAFSFILHFYGSYKDENEHLQKKDCRLKSAINYIADCRFWFESFQNWQSEFLSVFAIVALSIYLRQKGSPQSKPVDAPHSETGE